MKAALSKIRRAASDQLTRPINAQICSGFPVDLLITSQ